jgi:hypothetical protein
MENWKTIIYRPSVDNGDSYKAGQLENAFSELKLIDKTVCEDRIVYIFSPK